MLVVVILLVLSTFVSARLRVIQINSQTNSMYPTINRTSKIVVYLTQSPRLNDIINFRQPGNITLISGNTRTEYHATHRIVGSTKEGFITKGDNNDYLDNWIVPRENIIGKVVRVI